jgi:hypothetical protein
VAPPTFEQFRRWIDNPQTEDIAREIYDGLVGESGRYVWELLFAALKLSKATVVDFAAVTTPVLVIGAYATASWHPESCARQPGISTWCFPELRCPSPWATLTTGLPVISCPPSA